MAQVDRLADLVVERFGGIDIWVNNAARLMVKPLLETTDEDWHGLPAANLHGYFYGCRAAGRATIDSAQPPDGGRIINVSSAADILVVADAVVFLACDASRYVTGHELVIDGALSINGTMGHVRD